MSRPGVAVIQFPGSNCERETARALESAGLSATIIRWNEGARLISSCHACVLPGGFSFQDRIRAGAVAAKEPVMEAVAAMADSGRPVLGICNGAQILVESGLVPGWAPGSVEAALAANDIPGRSGYLSGWAFVRVAEGASRSPWLAEAPGGAIPLPFAHAEGRFEFAQGTSLDHLISRGTPGLLYCRRDGSPALGFPANPNGSSFSLAGILNPGGNVLAMMPHPERAAMLWQVPPALGGSWGGLRRASRRLDVPGPGAALFLSLATFLGAGS